MNLLNIDDIPITVESSLYNINGVFKVYPANKYLIIFRAIGNLVFNVYFTYSVNIKTISK